MKPFLSIIIPVYKVEAYLRECLDSIAVSELDCWEAILIDDGSPDGCPQICDEYSQKDRRFCVIHQQNAGVAAARNAGLDIAQGEWVWFVDSDDVVDMTHVGEIVEWIENVNDNENDDQNENSKLHETERCSYETQSYEDDKTKNKRVDVHVDVPVNRKVDLVMFDLETFKENETLSLRNAVATKRYRYENEELCTKTKTNTKTGISRQDGVVKVTVSNDKNDYLMKYICYHHVRLWYKSEKCRIRFTCGIRLAEDLEFQYKYLTLCEHPVKMDATLYHYRLHKGSATMESMYRVRIVEDFPIVLNNLVEWNLNNKIKPEPWYDFRIMKLFQNMLYSGSQAKGLDIPNFQFTVHCLLDKYQQQGFLFPDRLKYKMARWNIRGYFFINRFYLISKKFCRGFIPHK